jgi:hypothetical protein
MAYNPVICAGAGGGAIATWSQSAFLETYPNFRAVPGPTLEANFNIATIYCRNDGTSPITKVAVQTALLYMLTAHLLQLTVGPNGGGAIAGGNAPGLVGRVSSASEGSVSVSTDYPSEPNNAWFLQTPYGANFWQATANYRRARYIPGPTRFGTGIGNGVTGGGLGYFPGRRTR